MLREGTLKWCTAGISASLLCILFVGHFSYAQLSIPGISINARAVTLTTSPQNPGPGESVTVTARSFSHALSRADIVWRINGTVILSGVGETVLETRVGSAGSETRISFSAVTEESEQLESTLTLRPASVDISWEARTYTPPLFRGRSLPTPGSTVYAEATPSFIRGSGARVPDTQIVYTWKLNGRVLGDQSGRGKSSLSITIPFPSQNDILSVEAVSSDNTLRADSFVRIPTRDPYLVLYPVDPLTDVSYTEALELSRSVNDSELTVAAAPYYADADNPNAPTLQYRWVVNGATIPSDPNNGSRITFGFGASAARARISLTLSHADHFLQSADRTWNLTIDPNDVLLERDPFRRSTDIE